TGGRLLIPANPKQVSKAFAKISDELRSRYAISYKPAAFAPDGRFRKIRCGGQFSPHAKSAPCCRASGSCSAKGKGARSAPFVMVGDLCQELRLRWRAVLYARAESRVCIDRSSSRPTQFALACRSDKLRRMPETFCSRSA